MPLEVQRLIESDLYLLSSGDEFKAAISLWCKSWSQIPGGSLPNDDKLLAPMSGAKVWGKVKEVAMRGWVKCSDGRLYHPVVAENALKAWDSRQDYTEANGNKVTRQQRWREQLKALAEQLRAKGITPPAGASKAKLESLLAETVDKTVDSSGDATGDAKASTAASTVDGRETGNKSKGERQLKGDKKRKGAKAPLSADNLPTWMQDLVNLYQEILPELPGVRVMDKEREQTLRDFWHWVMTTNRPDGTPRATNDGEALAWARDYLQLARKNDFIMGRGPKSADHQNWRCSIEYLFSSRGMKKVIEETKE